LITWLCEPWSFVRGCPTSHLNLRIGVMWEYTRGGVGGVKCDVRSSLSCRRSRTHSRSACTYTFSLSHVHHHRRFTSVTRITITEAPLSLPVSTAVSRLFAPPAPHSASLASRDHCCCSVSQLHFLRHDAMPWLHCRPRGQLLRTSGAVLLPVLFSAPSSEDMSVPLRHHGRVCTEHAHSSGPRSGISAPSTGFSAGARRIGGGWSDTAGILCSVR
jgi:hypothetical protein